MTHALELHLPRSVVLVERAGPFVIPEHEWLQLDIQTPVPMPEDLDRWRRERLQLAESAIRIMSSFRGTSSDGWPFELLDIVRMEESNIVETRLVADYEMLGHAASVTVRVVDRGLIAVHPQSLLLPMLTSARPIWRPESPAALAELWSLRQSAQ